MQSANLPKTLSAFRCKHRLSINQLSKLTGISRRTLARIEDGYYARQESTHRSLGVGGPNLSPRIGSGSYSHQSRPPRLSPRIAMRLTKVLMPPDQLQQALADYTEPYLGPDLSPAESSDPDFDLLNLFPELYPAFLFHHSPPDIRRQFEQEFAPDYENAFFRLIVAPGTERNLARRLRAFRLQYDLTLRETADLLDLSTSELHRLERAQRAPSPRTRFRLLRLLTLPVSPEEVLSTRAGASRRSPRQRRGVPLPPTHASGAAQPFLGGKRRSSRAGTTKPGTVLDAPTSGGQGRMPRAGKNTPRTGEGRAGSDQRRQRPAPPKPGGRRRWLDALKALLSLPPPHPIEFEDDPDCLHRLRYLWLTAPSSTRDLAALLDVSQPHLIRLLRGDRRPGRALRHRLEQLVRPSSAATPGA